MRKQAGRWALGLGAVLLVAGCAAPTPTPTVEQTVDVMKVQGWDGSTLSDAKYYDDAIAWCKKEFAPATADAVNCFAKAEELCHWNNGVFNDGRRADLCKKGD